MALVLTKSVSRNVPLLKCMKGRKIATLAKKNPAVAVNVSIKCNSFGTQRVQTLACWCHKMIKQTAVPVAKKRTCRMAMLPRCSSCSALVTRRATIHGNQLPRSRSSVNLNKAFAAFITTPVNNGYYISTLKSKNAYNSICYAGQQKVSCSSGPGKKDKDSQAAPCDIRAMGPCNCPWPGGCPPPGFCNQQGGGACNPCAIGCGCCSPCPQCGPCPQCSQCPQCPMCGGCPQCSGPCGPFVPCGACGAACSPCGPACGPACGPCGPCGGAPCSSQMPGSFGPWGPCCGGPGGPSWGPQGVPCPFPCPCSPCGQCGASGSGADMKKKK